MAEEAQSNKSPALKPSTLVAGIFAFLIIFSAFAMLSGCLQSINFGDAAGAVFGNDTAKVATQNACALGFMSFGISVAGWFLGLAGTIFDYSLLAFVVSMGGLIGEDAPFANGIQLGWTIIRDLVNLAFIGGLIYAAISLILKLGAQNVGQLVVRIIVAALLVNFSYFFGAVIIDTSNFVSQKIYEEAISIDNTDRVNPFSFSGLAQAGTQSGLTAPVSERFMVVTRLGSLYDLRTEDFAEGGEFAENSTMPYIISFIGAVLFSMTAAIFATAAIFLIIRFVIIVILLITAPIGILYFVGVPPFTNWGKAWWDTLIAQALFPVVFLILVGISFKVMELGFVDAVAGDKSLFNLVTNPSDLEDWYANLNLLMVFGVAWFFMYFSLQAASNIAQQKQFTPPSPAALFAGASGFQKTVAGLYPRQLLFNFARKRLEGSAEATLEGIGSAGRWTGREIRGATGDILTLKPLRDFTRDIGIPAIPSIPPIRESTRARRDVDARRTARIAGYLDDAMSTDAETAAKGRKGLKEEFDRMSAEDRAKRWNGMSARQRAALEDSLPADMVAKMREDAKKGGKIDAAAKEARGTSGNVGVSSVPADLAPVVRAIAASDSHEAVRDDREMYRALLSARSDKKAMQGLVAEMRKNNISLAKLPAEILQSKHVAAELRVQDLHEIGRNTRDITYEQYEKIVRKTNRDTRKRFLSGPGKYGRPVSQKMTDDTVEPDEDDEAPPADNPATPQRI